jgi:DNA polymerase III subunit delta
LPAAFSHANPLPAQTFDQLEFEISRGKFCPIYLFLGQEEYLLRQAIVGLKEKAVPAEARSFNVIVCSARDAGADRIIAEANTYPMMSPRRLVLVTDIHELPPEELEAISAYAASPQVKTVLVLVAPEVDRRTSFYKRMSDLACVVEFAKLKGAGLERWAESQLSRRGYRIAPLALKKLVDFAGSDLLTLASEIEKLILYSGKEKQIQDSAVDLLVPASRQHGVFELTGAMGRRDRKTALRLLGNLLESGEPPLVLLTMMARHFRQVIIAKELLAEGRQAREIGRIAQVPEFALAEFLRQAQNFELDMARNLYQRLARMDRSFKSSSPDERMMMEQLICSL